APGAEGKRCPDRQPPIRSPISGAVAPLWSGTCSWTARFRVNDPRPDRTDKRPRGSMVPTDEALRRAEETDKVKELILLVTERSEGDESFGMIKLNKLLFNIDFTQYGRT